MTENAVEAAREAAFAEWLNDPQREREGITRSWRSVFDAGWYAADEHAGATLDYATKQIEARDSLLASYRVGHLTRKAESTIDALDSDAVTKLRAARGG